MEAEEEEDLDGDEKRLMDCKSVLFEVKGAQFMQLSVQESEPEAPEPPPSLQEILEAALVDEGNNIEYELDPVPEGLRRPCYFEVPMLNQRDPHTGIRIKTNEEVGSPFLFRFRRKSLRA